MRFHFSLRGTFLHLLTITALLTLPRPAPAQTHLDHSLIKDLTWRNIGNANLKGRISAIDALDSDWSHVIVGTASGGVFKSVNGGTTWTSIFDHYGAASIGDVRLFQPNPDIIWVGTGEECGRNSATWGDGVYKSTDGGRSFTNMGLRDSFNIGSVLTHPTDPNIVYVTALGCIWGPVGDRGLFKTTDGGHTWTKLTNGLPPDDKKTGALYIIMDPSNPDILYVSFWARIRTPWQLTSGGPNGGIFKSTDAGKSWRKLTNGLPPGDSGKIGLAIAASNPKVLMAHYEATLHPEPGTPDYDDMTKLGTGIYRSEDAGESWQYLNRYWSRPFYYNHIAINPLDDKLTYHPNQTFQMSTDGGRTLSGGRGGGAGFARGGRGAGARGPDTQGAPGATEGPAVATTAPGAESESTQPRNELGHCWHAIWLDPHNKNRFYTGSDGGVHLTHDGGRTYVTFKNINATQYYRLAVDMRDPYYVYGGLQDAGTSGGPSMTRARAIYDSDWISVYSGDGMHVLADPNDWRTVYAERDPRGQGGDVQRFNVETREIVSIRPQKGQNITNYDQYITPEIEQMQLDKGWGPSPGAGSGAFRWNWNQALAMSPHDSRTIYLGANHLFKSTDRGDTWSLISPDLTKNDPVRTKKGSGGLTPDEVPGGGAEYYGTIVCTEESPILPGVIWVGTDDGNVQVSRNGGKTWTNTLPNIKGPPPLPGHDMYVSRVEPSHFDAGTCFISLDGHKLANFQPWIFKTTDYGASWTNISGNLPDHDFIHVIRQDRKNPDLFFAGTEFAIYYSINGGKHWSKLSNNLPTVAVHDILIHPRDNDLIIGTHGRGIWIMDDISALEQLTPDILSSEAHLFTNKTATRWLTIEPMDPGGAYYFQGQNPTRNAVINYYLGPNATGEVTIEISDRQANNPRTRRYITRATPGINKLEWDMRFSPAPPTTRTNAPDDDDDDKTFPIAQQTPPGGARGGPQRGSRGGAGRGFGARGGAAAGAGGDTAQPGVYKITLTLNNKTYTSSITIRPDPMLGAN